jgi:hypothetical protein
MSKDSSEEDTDKMDLGMYIEYLPEEFGNISVDIYFDQEKNFSGIALDYTEVVKAIAKDEDAVGKIQIILRDNDTSDIDIPSAKTVSMQELLE